jgi:DNA repair protein RadC
MKFTENAVIFRENVQNMDELEILKYLLKFTVPVVKIDSVADSLIDQFGSLKNIFEARPEQLRSVKGIGIRSAELLSSFPPVVRTWQRLNTDVLTDINNTRKAEAFCKSLLCGGRVEEVWCICLNAGCKLIGKRKISTGSLSEVSAYPRLIVETALNYNAHSVLLTHNHPGGTCEASREDIVSTRNIQRLLNGLGIMLLDHIIVAGDNTYSMIQHGDIDYRMRDR